MAKGACHERTPKRVRIVETIYELTTDTLA
jgi:hypothetical protein